MDNYDVSELLSSSYWLPPSTPTTTNQILNNSENNYLSRSSILEPIMEETSDDDDDDDDDEDDENDDDVDDDDEDNDNIYLFEDGDDIQEIWASYGHQQNVWSSESDTGSVIRVEINQDPDTRSERDFACPAKRPRRQDEFLLNDDCIIQYPNRIKSISNNNNNTNNNNDIEFKFRIDCIGANENVGKRCHTNEYHNNNNLDVYSDCDSLSYNSLSRSSSLIQFESLERQMQQCDNQSFGGSTPSLCSTSLQIQQQLNKNNYTNYEFNEYNINNSNNNNNNISNKKSEFIPSIIAVVGNKYSSGGGGGGACTAGGSGVIGNANGGIILNNVSNRKTTMVLTDHYENIIYDQNKKSSEKPGIDQQQKKRNSESDSSDVSIYSTGNSQDSCDTEETEFRKRIIENNNNNNNNINIKNNCIQKQQYRCINSVENLSEDSGYGELITLKNRSKSIPNFNQEPSCHLIEEENYDNHKSLEHLYRQRSHYNNELIDHIRVNKKNNNNNNNNNGDNYYYENYDDEDDDDDDAMNDNNNLVQRTVQHSNFIIENKQNKYITKIDTTKRHSAPSPSTTTTTQNSSSFNVDRMAKNNFIKNINKTNNYRMDSSTSSYSTQQHQHQYGGGERFSQNIISASLPDILDHLNAFDDEYNNRNNNIDNSVRNNCDANENGYSLTRNLENISRLKRQRQQNQYTNINSNRNNHNINNNNHHNIIDLVFDNKENFVISSVPNDLNIYSVDGGGDDCVSHSSEHLFKKHINKKDQRRGSGGGRSSLITNTADNRINFIKNTTSSVASRNFDLYDIENSFIRQNKIPPSQFTQPISANNNNNNNNNNQFDVGRQQKIINASYSNLTLLDYSDHRQQYGNSCSKLFRKMASENLKKKRNSDDVTTKCNFLLDEISENFDKNLSILNDQNANYDPVTKFLENEKLFNDMEFNEELNKKNMKAPQPPPRKTQSLSAADQQTKLLKQKLEANNNQQSKTLPIVKKNIEKITFDRDPTNLITCYAESLERCNFNVMSVGGGGAVGGGLGEGSSNSINLTTNKMYTNYDEDDDDDDVRFLKPQLTSFAIIPSSPKNNNHRDMVSSTPNIYLFKSSNPSSSSMKTQLKQNTIANNLDDDQYLKISSTHNSMNTLMASPQNDDDDDNNIDSKQIRTGTTANGILSASSTLVGNSRNSLTKGVSFCPVVSEISWKEQSSEECLDDGDSITDSIRDENKHSINNNNNNISKNKIINSSNEKLTLNRTTNENLNNDDNKENEKDNNLKVCSSSTISTTIQTPPTTIEQNDQSIKSSSSSSEIDNHNNSKTSTFNSKPYIFNSQPTTFGIDYQHHYNNNNNNENYNNNNNNTNNNKTNSSTSTNNSSSCSSSSRKVTNNNSTSSNVMIVPECRSKSSALEISHQPHQKVINYFDDDGIVKNRKNFNFNFNKSGDKINRKNNKMNLNTDNSFNNNNNTIKLDDKKQSTVEKKHKNGFLSRFTGGFRFSLRGRKQNKNNKNSYDICNLPAPPPLPQSPVPSSTIQSQSSTFVILNNNNNNNLNQPKHINNNNNNYNNVNNKNKDVIFIPLRDPKSMSQEYEQQQYNLNINDEQLLVNNSAANDHGGGTKLNGNTLLMMKNENHVLTGKPPLPRQPPRIVGISVKHSQEQQQQQQYQQPQQKIFHAHHQQKQQRASSAPREIDSIDNNHCLLANVDDDDVVGNGGNGGYYGGRTVEYNKRYNMINNNNRNRYNNTNSAGINIRNNNNNNHNNDKIGLIETNLDTHETIITGKTRSLMELAGPQNGNSENNNNNCTGGVNDSHACKRAQSNVANNNCNNNNQHYRNHQIQTVEPRRPHKSMEFLLDKENQKIILPPENELQKSHDNNMTLSEHQLRVQASLQRLNIPDWFKQYNPTTKQSGTTANGNGPYVPGNFTKKRGSDVGRWTGLNSKTTSLNSLGGSSHRPDRSPLMLSPSAHSHHGQTGFSRWSTSHLNSSQTSPSQSARGSFSRGPQGVPHNSGTTTGNGGTNATTYQQQSHYHHPQNSSIRNSFRQPYLGWRSQEKLSQRTPSERLASTILSRQQHPPQNQQQQQQQQQHNQQQQQTKSSEMAVTPEIQSSIKEVTSAIVHYVNDQNNRTTNSRSRSASPSSRKCWLESSFVGNRPLDSPQTPVIDNNTIDPTRIGSGAMTTTSSTTINGVVTPLPLLSVHPMDRPSPGSATLEDVLASLLGLPSDSYRCSGDIAKSILSSDQYSRLHIDINSAALRRHSEGDAQKRNDSDKKTTTDQSIKNKNQQLPPRRISLDSSSQSTTTTNTTKTINTTTTQQSTSKSEMVTTDIKSSYPYYNNQDNNQSLQDNDFMVKCRYPKCNGMATPIDAKKLYKSCHNCSNLYCSRECRRMHWEKHRKACLHSRVSVLCRQVLSACKDDQDTQYYLSQISRTGYLQQGRGVIRILFRSPELAEKFVKNGIQYIGESSFVRWPELQPQEMGPELYAELLKLSTEYKPNSKMLIYVAICVLSETPGGTAVAPVQWERKLVSRCAKLKLCKSIIGTTSTSNAATAAAADDDDDDNNDGAAMMSSTSPPNKTIDKPSSSSWSTASTPQTVATNENTTSTTTPNLNATQLEKDILILTFNIKNKCSQKLRELILYNIEKALVKRGVILQKHYPEVFQKLSTFVDGVTTERFYPVTIHPRNIITGQQFICIIMPNGGEFDKIKLPESDGSNVIETIDCLKEYTDQQTTTTTTTQTHNLQYQSKPQQSDEEITKM